MRFLEFGKKQNRAMILIHGFLSSWKMWLPQIDFFSKDYYVIVPVLDGHDLEDSSSTFTTIEKASHDIIDHVIHLYGTHIFALCGASLGATIGINLLAQNKLKIDKAIIDCGPVVPMNKFLLNFFIRIRLRQIHQMKKGSHRLHKTLSASYLPAELVDETFKIGAHMTNATCRNVLESVYSYSLPTSMATCQTDITYWYGSKESMFGKKYAKALLDRLPHAKINVFEGCQHGELCIGKPQQYIKEAVKFLGT